MNWSNPHLVSSTSFAWEMKQRNWVRASSGDLSTLLSPPQVHNHINFYWLHFVPHPRGKVPGKRWRKMIGLLQASRDHGATMHCGSFSSIHSGQALRSLWEVFTPEVVTGSEEVGRKALCVSMQRLLPVGFSLISSLGLDIDSASWGLWLFTCLLIFNAPLPLCRLVLSLHTPSGDGWDCCCLFLPLSFLSRHEIYIWILFIPI